jgi:exonuclease III
MRFGMRNIRGLNWAVSLMIVSRKLSKYKADFVGMQEVRWEGSGTKRTHIFLRIRE